MGKGCQATEKEGERRRGTYSKRVYITKWVVFDLTFGTVAGGDMYLKGKGKGER